MAFRIEPDRIECGGGLRGKETRPGIRVDRPEGDDTSPELAHHDELR